MTAVSITTGQLSVIDRAAVRLGTKLTAWGRTRAARRRDWSELERYRVDYDDKVRNAAARDRAGLLP